MKSRQLHQELGIYSSRLDRDPVPPSPKGRSPKREHTLELRQQSLILWVLLLSWCLDVWWWPGPAGILRVFVINLQMPENCGMLGSMGSLTRGGQSCPHSTENVLGSFLAFQGTQWWLGRTSWCRRKTLYPLFCYVAVLWRKKMPWMCRDLLPIWWSIGGFGKDSWCFLIYLKILL